MPPFRPAKAKIPSRQALPRQALHLRQCGGLLFEAVKRHKTIAPRPADWWKPEDKTKSCDISFISDEKLLFRSVFWVAVPCRGK
jgi:hypothetical protein